VLEFENPSPYLDKNPDNQLEAVGMSVSCPSWSKSGA